jgi:hypothetical protein
VQVAAGAVQTPVVQLSPVMQSAAVVQVVLQAVVPQT